jgi:hypothetical protein
VGDPIFHGCSLQGDAFGVITANTGRTRAVNPTSDPSVAHGVLPALFLGITDKKRFPPLPKGNAAHLHYLPMSLSKHLIRNGSAGRLHQYSR